MYAVMCARLDLRFQIISATGTPRSSIFSIFFSELQLNFFSQNYIFSNIFFLADMRLFVMFTAYLWNINLAETKALVYTVMCARLDLRFQIISAARTSRSSIFSIFFSELQLNFISLKITFFTHFFTRRHAIICNVYC